MSARNKPGLCTYCGKQKKLTDDHVPPKLLLARPYPPNLLTVPACRECNASFMKDDEYTRIIVTLDVRAGRNRVGRENLPAVVRSLQRPTASAFAQYLANQSTVTTILGPNGAPMGHEIETDIRRLNRTGAHIIRGLHYIETGKPIPKSAEFKIACKTELTASQPDTLTVGRLLVACPERREGAVGEAFSYVASFADGFSMCVLLLYDYFFWVCTVDDRDLSERESIPAPPQ